jgi:hypothetical protein
MPSAKKIKMRKKPINVRKTLMTGEREDGRI